MQRSDSQKSGFLGHQYADEFLIDVKYSFQCHQWIQEVSTFMNDDSLLPQNSSLDDVIETVLLQCMLRLIPNLGHHVDSIRTQVSNFLLQLAAIFNSDLDKQAILLRIASVQTIYECTDMLFRGIGKSLNNLVIALVAGLEGQYLHPNIAVRDVAICISTRLIFENSTIFAHQDNFAAVWNLYFLLDWLSGSKTDQKIFRPQIISRLPILHSLRILSPVYISKPSLTEQITTRLLILPDKSLTEMIGVKEVLSEIFKQVLIHNQKHEENSYSLFMIFINVLTAHHEYHYDLLYWAVERYIDLLNGSPTQEKKVESISLPQEVLDFYSALSNHLRASPALIRYGSAMCLHALLSHFPELLEPKNDAKLYAMLVCGCFDPHRLTGRLYLTILQEQAARLKLNEVTACCALALTQLSMTTIKISFQPKSKLTKKEESSESDSDNESQDSMLNMTPRKVNCSPLISIATSKGPCPPWSFLTLLLSSLEFLPIKTKLHQLCIISGYCKRMTVLNLSFIQMLMPMLTDSNPQIQDAVIDIFRALSTTLPEITDHLFFGVTSYFSSGLGSETDSRLPRLLNAITTFPYERLPSARLHDILDTLLGKLLHQSKAIRQSLYAMLAHGCKFWKDKNLLAKAMTMLLLALHDRDIDCVKTAIVGALKLGETFLETYNLPQDDALIEALYNYQDELAHRNVLNRLRAYDRLCRCFPTKFDNSKQSKLKIPLEDQKNTSLTVYILNILQSATMRSFHITLIQLMESNIRLHFFPHWIAMLQTQIGLQMKKRSNKIPALLLQPLLSSQDHTVRLSACHALKRACFMGSGPKNTIDMNHGLLHELLKIFPRQMTQSPFQCESVFFFLHTLVPLKVPGLNQQLIDRFAELALDKLENASTTSFNQRAILLFLEAILSSRPRQCIQFTERLRNRIRELLGIVVTTGLQLLLSNVYCLLAHNTGVTGDDKDATEFINYLKNDLNIQQNGQSSDPLSTSLSPQQKEFVAIVTIRALGCLKHISTAETIIELLLPLLKHRRAEFRKEAIIALNQQLITLKEDINVVAPIHWSLLPFIADQDSSVRAAFHSSIIMQQLPSPLTYRLSLLPPELDDNDADYETSPTPVTSALLSMDNQSLASGSTKNVQIVSPENKQSNSSSPKKLVKKGVVKLLTTKEQADAQVARDKKVNELLAAIDSHKPFYHQSSPERVKLSQSVNFKPRAGEAFFSEVNALAEQKLPQIPTDLFDETEYTLRQLFGLRGVGGAAAVVLGHLCNDLDATVASSILSTLLYQVSSVVTNSTEDLIKGSVFAIQVILKKHVWGRINALEHFGAISVLRHGDLLALANVVKYLNESMNQFNDQKVAVDNVFSKELVEALAAKLINLIESTSETRDCKDLAMQILTGFSTALSPERLSVVIEYIFNALANSTDPYFHELCSVQLQKLFVSLPANHSSTTKFLGALEQGSSEETGARLRAVTTLSVLTGSLSTNQRKALYMRFLLDPVKDVRRLALQTMLDSANDTKLVHVILPVVKRITNEDLNNDLENNTDEELRDILFQLATASVHNPEDSQVSEKTDEKEKVDSKVTKTGRPGLGLTFTIPLEDNDPLNYSYLQSRNYLKLLNTYGLELPKTSSLETNDITTSKQSGERPSSTQNTDREAKARFRAKMIGEIRARRAARQSTFGDILEALGSTDSKMLDELLTVFTKPLFAYAENSNTSNVADHINAQDNKVHNLKLFFRLQGTVQSGAKFSHVLSVQKGILKYRSRSVTLRGIILGHLHTLAMGNNRIANNPVSKAEEGSGRSRQESGHATRRQEKKTQEQARVKLQHDINQATKELSLNNKLQREMVFCVTNLLCDESKSYDGAHVEQSLGWLDEMFTDSHRGISYAARNGIISIVQARLPVYDQTKLKLWQNNRVVISVHKLIEKYHKSLKDPIKATALRRRKGDALILLSELTWRTHVKVVRNELIPLLVKFWDDASPYVVKSSVDIILNLTPDKFPEMEQFINPPPNNKSDSAFLLSNILRRIRQNAYMHSDQLNRVLETYFV